MYKKFLLSVKLVIYSIVTLVSVASNQKIYSMMSEQELGETKRIIRSCGPDPKDAAPGHRRNYASFAGYHIVYERPYANSTKVGAGAWRVEDKHFNRPSRKTFPMHMESTDSLASVCDQCDALLEQVQRVDPKG